MSKNKTSSNTSEVSVISPETTIMTDTTISPSTTIVHDPVVVWQKTFYGRQFTLETLHGQPNMGRFTIAPEGHTWNADLDAYITNLGEAQAALSMFARIALGEVIGNSHLFGFAPEDKLAQAHGVGRGWYVRAGFNAAKHAVITETGTVLSLSDDVTVPQAEMTFLPLRQVGPSLWNVIGSSPITPNGVTRTWVNKDTKEEGSWTNADFFWRLFTTSVVLGGNALSVSVGPKLFPEALDLIQLLDSSDLKAAVSTRGFENREGGRAAKSIFAAAETQDEANLPTSADAYTVPNLAGGNVDLLTTVGGTINLVLPTGRPVRRVFVASPAVALATANEVNNRSWSVSLR